MKLLHQERLIRIRDNASSKKSYQTRNLYIVPPHLSNYLGTAGDICLVRESVANSSASKFVGHKLQLALPKGLERDRLADVPVIKVAGNVGDGHPKDHKYEWSFMKV